MTSPKQHLDEIDVLDRDVTRVAAIAATAASIEYYDFFIYGLAAALVFPAVFFPEMSSVTGVLLSFGTFGIGFLARPLGGVVFGHFGDLIGRKKTLVIALIAMGIASTAIGVLPTYASVGVLAPVALTVLRFVQGIAIGGQMGGVVLLAVEAAPPRRRGFYGSFSSLGAPGGVLLANVIFLLLTACVSTEALIEWAWRLPFLMSLILVGLALYVHVKLEDTPSFRRLQELRQSAPVVVTKTRSPVWTVLRTYPAEVALTAGSYIGINLTYYLFITFVISYGTSTLGLSQSTMLAAVLIGSTGQVLALPLAGAVSDRIGRSRVYLCGAFGLAVFAFPFWMLVQTGQFWLITVAMVVGLGVLHSLMYGVQPAFFAETFSTEVRYSGVSLGIQSGAVIGGAFAPMTATALLSSFGWPSVALYMMAGCVLTGLSVWVLAHRNSVRSQEVIG
ncbi:MFS transporter [Mycolicibacterium smegmatis]|uniref:Shikimate transporter n=1 Tax=Mycolicibacterium smegmatis (strain ATCC 700084 / mc(2)155) TaxID=246196 RepID=A0QXQ4_MYCS2|nr:MFS transporter [Mycolicibacterium smegmatis]ABK73996.1 shikimate transporter [Mycolicibacterium smegmatis MC2 155]MBE9621408.1 MHS family MFS transporter [Mycolicibacterium smegmatis]MBE9627803.1 MHS family MFS transporter [Mycolicibacterium smegmatis]MBE9634238.1 MHS family MFS transporter [Mycolicibacterium smegmatis]MBE9646433.1 MHS family MFS transporter [Mycolicibacterium smegmatis]